MARMLEFVGDRCQDQEELLRLFREAGRRAPDSRTVWSHWRSFKESGWLSRTQVMALQGVSRKAPQRLACCCPYCDSELVDYPWTGRGRARLQLSELDPIRFDPPPGFRFVLRRLVGLFTLAPVALLGFLVALALWTAVATFRPHQLLAADAQSPRVRLVRFLRFTFYEDFMPRHAAAALATLALYGLTAL